MLRASWKRTGTRLLVFVLAGFLALVGVALGGDLRDARKETEQSYREWRESERELEQSLAPPPRFPLCLWRSAWAPMSALAQASPLPGLG